MSEITAAVLVGGGLLVLAGTIALRLIARWLNPIAADPAIGWPPYIKREPWAAALGWAGAAVVMFTLTVALVGLAWYLLTPTWQEVFDRHAARFTALGDRLAQIGQELPPRGSVAASRCREPLTPPPTLANTEFVDAAALQEGTDLYDSAILDLGGNDLALYIHWLRQPPVVNDAKAGPDVARDMEAALATRYIVAYRETVMPPAEVATPSPVDTLHYEAFIVHVPNKKRVCEIAFAASDRQRAGAKLARAMREVTGSVEIR